MGKYLRCYLLVKGEGCLKLNFPCTFASAWRHMGYMRQHNQYQLPGNLLLNECASYMGHIQRGQLVASTQGSQLITPNTEKSGGSTGSQLREWVAAE